MPAKKGVPKMKAATKAELQGEGFMDILKGVNKFLRKHKVISKTAGVLDLLEVPLAGKVKKTASVLGYGSSGGSLRPGGSRGGAMRPGGSTGGALRPGGSSGGALRPGGSRGACRGRGKPKKKTATRKTR